MNTLSKIKKIIKNPSALFQYMGSRGLLDWISDEIYIKILYKSIFNKSLNLKDPKTFNEKIQWLKLNDKNILYTSLVDKYEVRKYISEKIGDEYLIPLVGVWDNFESIDFDMLPEKFVLKTTHDSGGVIVCKNKKEIIKKKFSYKINKSLKRNYYDAYREWPYKNVKPRIIVEKFMETDNGDIKDYKFFCFNGEPKLILVCSERFSKEGLKETFFDTWWNITDIRRPGHSIDINIPKPKKLEEMLGLAKKLSVDKTFIRVDFYEVNGQVYFGELTFYPSSGFLGFEPEKYDAILGEWINIPNI